MNKEERVFYPLGCFCCFPSGPLLVDAYAPVQGYTPGQTINVTVKVNNESNETLSHFDVELIKVRQDHLLERKIIVNIWIIHTNFF